MYSNHLINAFPNIYTDGKQSGFRNGVESIKHYTSGDKEQMVNANFVTKLKTLTTLYNAISLHNVSCGFQVS